MMLNGLDLFSGIGGITRALEPWVRPIAYCENDRYSQSVLLDLMRQNSLPIAPIWDDVNTLRGRDLPVVPDIIYGGFPCQDISVAGHGVGINGSRSGLFWQMHRLIKEIEPKFVFLENVPAIRTRGAIEVARSLTELGYNLSWDVVSAREFGAPFVGKRWFLVATSDSKTVREQFRWWIRQGWKKAPLDSPASEIGITPWTSKRGFKQRIFRANDGLPYGVDRNRCLGNAVVPVQARAAFKRLMGIN